MLKDIDRLILDNNKLISICQRQNQGRFSLNLTGSNTTENMSTNCKLPLSTPKLLFSYLCPLLKFQVKHETSFTRNIQVNKKMTITSNNFQID